MLTVGIIIQFLKNPWSSLQIIAYITIIVLSFTYVIKPIRIIQALNHAIPNNSIVLLPNTFTKYGIQNHEMIDENANEPITIP